MKKRPIDFLRSPWVVFSGMIAGIIIGIKYNALALKLAPFGNIYLSLLQMCIVPIMITAVVSSIGRLLTTAQASKYIGRLVLVFLLGMVFACIHYELSIHTKESTNAELVSFCSERGIYRNWILGQHFFG